MKLVNSRTTQLDYGQIMMQYHQNHEANKPGPLKNLQTWLLTTAQLMAQLKAEGMIIGNTFFMYKRGSDEDSNKTMFWAMNADTLQNMVENLAEFFTRIVSTGVTDFVAMYEHDPMTNRISRQAFNKIKLPSDEIKFKKIEHLTCLHATLSGGEDV
jgi:hypothetical protein